MKTKLKLKSPDCYSDTIHLKIIKHLSMRGSSFSYIGIIRSIKDIAKELYLKVGTNKAKLLLVFYVKQKDFIIKKDTGIYLLNEKYLS